MIRKLFYISLGIVAVCIYVLNTDQKILSSTSENLDISNGVDKIEYNFTIDSDRKLKLKADKVSFEGMDIVKFKNIIANITSKNEVLTVKAKNTTFLIKDKFIKLRNNVDINSSAASINTESADFDINKNILTCNSKVTGQQNGISFSAEGCVLKNNKELILKKAKFIK